MLAGDCMERLPELGDASVDSCVTDPPYHLTSITKRFGAANAAPAQYGVDGAFARASRGFMGQQWDGGDIAFQPEVWREVLRVLKPGGHLIAFGGTRTYHRMVCAIEDVGFEVRDQIGWVYGTGFPKSKSVPLAIDKQFGHPNRGHRIATASRVHPDGTIEPNGDDLPAYQARSDEARQWAGWGTALKPAWEPIVVARKPLVGTVAANVLMHGTGGLNIDACRVIGGSDNTGRWPANLIHDGGPAVLAAFAAFGESKSTVVRSMTQQAREPKSKGAEHARFRENVGFSDSGTAARFFYSAKASKADRAGSKHPTVKPVSLLRYLCRLVTPPGGIVLDPFAGSGTTGAAAEAEGFRAVLIEREAEYLGDIARRFAAEDGTAARHAAYGGN